MDLWCQNKWTGCFLVRLHIIKDVPNYTLHHILLQNNENKHVTHSRDTQDVPYVSGIYMLKILKDIKVKESLFDDFVRYENDEARIKQHKRSKLSHDAPDFVCETEKMHQMPSCQNLDRATEIHNVSRKLNDCNVIKHQDPHVEAGENQPNEAEKENGHQENHCNDKQNNENVAKTISNQSACWCD